MFFTKDYKHRGETEGAAGSLREVVVVKAAENVEMIRL